MEKKQLTIALFLAVLLSAICAVGCYTLFADDSKYENESDFNEEDSDEENEGDFDGGEEMTVYNGTCGDSATWTLNTDSNTLTISGTGAMYNYDMSSNKAPWYNYYSNCQNIIIEDGITSIGAFVFYYNWIRSITIPNSVTSIADNAFRDCNMFKWSIVIPDSVTSLGQFAFTGCHKITSISFGNGITSIAGSMLSRNTELTSITFGKNITSIGNSAFRDCSKVTSVTFMGDQPTFGDRALAFKTDSSGELITTIYSKGWASDSVFPEIIRGNGTFVYVTVSFNPEIPVNVGGTWKTATPYVNVGGEWKEVTEAYVNVGGTWKEVGK